jgi:hypothetical protein
MKDMATKQKFIELRAGDKSIRAIAKQLHISKDTASNWDKKFCTEIATSKNERLQELYKEYGMVKESRIRRIGEILQGLDEEIDRRFDPENNWTLRDMPMKDLLAMRQAYQAELNKEYAPVIAATGKDTRDTIRANFMAFMLKVQAGEINTSDMQKQAAAFIAMAQAETATQKSDPFNLAGLLGGGD